MSLNELEAAWKEKLAAELAPMKEKAETLWKECQTVGEQIKKAEPKWAAPWSIQANRVDYAIRDYLTGTPNQTATEIMGALPDFEASKITETLTENSAGDNPWLVNKQNRYSLVEGWKAKRKAKPAA